MDDNLSAHTKTIFKKNKPENEIAPSEIVNIAKCHQICLPHTATSKAGTDVLSLFYKTLVDDPSSLVLWTNGKDNDRNQYLGAFASASVDLEKTESRIKRAMTSILFLKLACYCILNPLHIIAGKIWKRLIPAKGAGYILTVGVTEEVKKKDPLINGKNLVLLIEQWFRDLDIKESWVDTEVKNRKAIAFYLSLGYKEVNRSFGQVLFKKALD